jgi:hypothetical protein
LYFLVDEYVNGNGDVVSDSFELKTSNSKAWVYSWGFPNLLDESSYWTVYGFVIKPWNIFWAIYQYMLWSPSWKLHFHPLV